MQDDYNVSGRVSSGLRAPQLQGQLIGSVEDNDDIYELAIYVQGQRIDLKTLKSLELVYGEDEIISIQCQLWCSDNFRPSVLDDEIINVSLTLLELSYPFIKCISTMTASGWRLSLKDTHVSKATNNWLYFYIPIAINDHRSLIVYDVVNHKITHYDSTSSMMSQSTYFDMFQKLSTVYRLAQKFSPPLNIIFEGEVEKNLDPGVQLLHRAQSVASQGPYEKLESEAVIRAELFQALIKNSY